MIRHARLSSYCYRHYNWKSTRDIDEHRHFELFDKLKWNDDLLFILQYVVVINYGYLRLLEYSINRKWTQDTVEPSYRQPFDKLKWNNDLFVTVINYGYLALLESSVG